MVNFQTSGGGPVSRSSIERKRAKKYIYSFLDALTISDGGREEEGERREVGSCRFLIELARSNLS